VSNWKNPYIIIHYFGNYPVNEAQLAPHAGRRTGGGPIMRTTKKSRNRDQLPGNNPMAMAITSAVASITGGEEVIMEEEEESSLAVRKRKLEEQQEEEAKRRRMDPLNIYGTVLGEQFVNSSKYSAGELRLEKNY